MRKILLFLLVGALPIVNSCEKKKDVQGCTDADATNYNADATVDDESCTYNYDASTDKNEAKQAAGNTTTGIYEDLMVFTMVQYESDNNAGLGKTNGTTPTPACANVSITPSLPTVWPKKLTIDFGTTNCLCDDGKYRTGKIEARFNDSWVTPTSNGPKDSMVVTLTNYHVNDTMLMGTRIFVKDSISASVLSITAIVNNAGVVFPGTSGNDTLNWSYTGSVKLTFGNKGDYNDNVVSLNISGNVDTKVGTYAIQTLQTLSTQFSCLSTCVFTAGQLKLSNTEAQSVKVGPKTYSASVTTAYTLDFGTGSCDGTINSSTNVVGVNTTDSSELFNESSSETINCDDFTDWE
ncbi:MAG: hypothetical protein J0M08_00775 [Bacteroidetes bacterium]|nr:hypothetical protein [Bacteroidota bacterium]